MMTSRQTHSAAGILDDEQRRNAGYVWFGHVSCRRRLTKIEQTQMMPQPEYFELQRHARAD